MEGGYHPPSSPVLIQASFALDTRQTFHQPPSPPFHGFGPETIFPSRLILETVGGGDEEEVIKVTRRNKTGRPQGGWEINPVISNLNILDDSRRSSEPSNTINSPTTSARSASPKTSLTPALDMPNYQNQGLCLMSSYPSLRRTWNLKKLPK